MALASEVTSIGGVLLGGVGVVVMMCHWTAGHVLAGLLWVLAIVLCVVDLLLPTNDIGHVGIVAAAGAGTLHIRCWLELSRTREREWYELGKMTEQSRPRSV